MMFRLFCFEYEIPPTFTYHALTIILISRLYFRRFLFRRDEQVLLTGDRLFRVGHWSRLEPARALHAVSEAGFESRTLILLTWP